MWCVVEWESANFHSIKDEDSNKLVVKNWSYKLFTISPCHECKQEIPIDSNRYHCFADRCLKDVNLCEKCFKEKGHEHPVFVEKGTILYP